MSCKNTNRKTTWGGFNRVFASEGSGVLTQCTHRSQQLAVQIRHSASEVLMGQTFRAQMTFKLLAAGFRALRLNPFQTATVIM